MSDALNATIKRLTAGLGRCISEEIIRASVNDGLQGCGALDPGYQITLEQIATSMINACTDFNGLEPAVVSFNPSQLPHVGWMRDGVVHHLYKILLHTEQDLDVGTAGSGADGVAARRIVHFNSNIERYGRSFMEGALRCKQQINRRQGFQPIG